MNPEYDSLNQNPVSVLIDCRTVVEKSDFVSTGILTFIEGDLIEIEIGDYKAYQLGDPVKVKVYSPIGIHHFSSSVIAIDEGAIIVLNPPEHQKKFIDRRAYPRVDADCKGEILSAVSLQTRKEEILPSPVRVFVRNISIGGMGFYLPKGDDTPELELETLVNMKVDINGNLSCSGKIVRKDSQDEGFLFGLQYMNIDPVRMNSLRAFVLRAQVQLRLKGRKQNEAATAPRKFK